MADRFDVTLEYVDYPVMDRGMNTTLPSRSMVPGGEGPLFTLVQNMVGHDGVLASWFGVFPLTEFVTNGYPTVERNGSYFETAPDGLLNGQTVMYQFWDYPQTWNNSTATTAQSSYGSFMGVVVTSREIWTYSPQDHNWYNATPVYSAGTITVNNGSTSVQGNGTAFVTRKIVPGQLIQLPAGTGDWYSITAVNADAGAAALTISPAYAGVNLVAQPYVIRRCFGGRNYSHGDNLLFCQVFNGDLYIGGRTLAGAGNGPAVIRVNSIYDTAQTSEYLLAGFDLTGSMSTNGSVIAELWDIKGLQLLTDGRVVLATAEVPSTKTGIVGNRLRYSSNTGNTAGTVSAQEIWVASPAGFIDVIDHPGEIKALGRLGPSTLSVHFDRGISLATYTAQYDPPLSIQSSGAKVGCFAPRTLCQYRGQEIFLGSDGLVHAFNGEETAELSDETVALEHDGTNYSASFCIANTHAVVDTRRSHYRLFFCDNNFEQVPTPPAAYANYTIRTDCWLIDLENPGQFYKEIYAPHITSAAFPAIGSGDDDIFGDFPTSVGGDFGLIILGVNTAPPSAAAEDLLAGAVLYGLSQRGGLSAPGNHVWDSDAYSDRPVFLAATDFLDFGKPGVDKTIDHILLYIRLCTLAINDLPVVQIFKPDGNFVTGTTKALVVPANAEPSPLMYDFGPDVSEAWKIKISLAVNNNALGQGLLLGRMRVYYQTQGEIEAVNPDL